jgi:DNA-binding MarR family transcriptional regulator
MKKDEFRKAIDTLKLYRRAELVDEMGKELINDLYVDPLPDEHILKTVLKPNTTFLIGRKGTGKSTIFQRAQECLNRDNSVTWAYIDIKTLYESSVADLLGNIPQGSDTALSIDAIRRISIFKSFVIELIKEIKDQINSRITSTLWNQVKEAFTGSASDLFEKLDEFIEDLQRNQYLDITGTILASKQDVDKATETMKIATEISAKLSSDPYIQAKMVAEMISELEKTRSQNYSQVFIQVFNIRELISRLHEILLTLKVQHLYIFVDDFSELPPSDMEQVVDTILAPFNNWSEEFIKLKIAVYPGRLYTGAIDLSKVDEIYLDIYRAYGQNDITSMEEKAKDFTMRLVSARTQYFCKEGPDEFFETSSQDLWLTLYHACLGNPRILGYILFYCYETNIIYDKRIGVKTIQDASRRYYEEKIGQYFRMHKFLHETFEERSSIYSLKDLFDEIVKRAKELRKYRGSKITQEITGRPPTSHFHVIRDYDQILSTLELNFFITKYSEMKDRDGREVSIYALNYGLCQLQSISFGRPTGKREHRLYFVERIFDYSPLISTYIKVNQEIVCNHCGKKQNPEMLPSLEAYDMLCPECKQGTCTLVNISRRYEKFIKSIESENLLPETELGILKTLHDEKKEMYAKELAAQLDCSYQLIGKRGRFLAERSLVTRDENLKGRRVFNITNTAQELYFEDTPEDRMSFEDQEIEEDDL